MSVWMLWWLPMIIAGVGMIAMSWWDIRHPTTRDDGILKLSDILLGVFLAVCPLINIFAALALVAYFLTEIAPKVVVIGRKS